MGETNKTEKKENQKKKVIKTVNVKKSKFIFAVGRRKCSVANIKLKHEKGEILVNGKPLEVYFPGEIAKIYYNEPFRITNTLKMWSGTARIVGGGRNAHLEALILGFARLLVKFDEKFKSVLRKRGFLTRDPRAKERKKPGLMGARKEKQSPKR